MKICLAQTMSFRGKIDKNIRNHRYFVKQAIRLKSDLLLFPELSITNYEPDLASDLATHLEDEVFDEFQALANEGEITICLGMPLRTEQGIHIGMLIFQAEKPRTYYAKQVLHKDEEGYFVCGDQHRIVQIKDQKVGLAICYESLQVEHFKGVKELGASIYLASVAKSEGGIEKAFAYFPSLAEEYKTPILMSNAIGSADNFISMGNSAVWDNKGKLLGQLDSSNEGLLVYDARNQSMETLQLEFRKGTLSDLDELYLLYKEGRLALDQQGIFQWNDIYPGRTTISEDLAAGDLHLLTFGHEIIGSVVLNDEQSPQYKSINWEMKEGRVLVIHRLVIHPKYHSLGYATRMMDYSEAYGEKQGYSSIRLDVYTKNPIAIRFYKKRYYQLRGDVEFAGRSYPFHCMEKRIKSA